MSVSTHSLLDLDVDNIIDGRQRIAVLRQQLPTASKTPAVLCDVDGTVALMGKGQPGRRGPFDWDRVSQDDPNWPIIALTWMFRREGYRIVFMSGRDEQCREQTERWLKYHNVALAGEPLHMRPHKNNDSDTALKLAMYRDHIEPDYQVEYVLDDREAVVAMWRALGLTVLQVADGDF